MNKLYTLLAIIFLSSFAVVNAQEPCLSEIQFQEDAKNNPELLKGREQLEAFTRSWIENHRSNPDHMQGAPYVIPVVFHVIHYGGSENISRDQCLSQLDSLNKDIRYLNSDNVNTPAYFQPIAADCNIEFRMAQIDPNGNCTDGVTRTYSPLTYNARNNVKSLIHWPSNQYLNIYTVSSITTSNGVIIPGQIVAGFAQFPGAGQNPATDGVVIRSSHLGNIGTAPSGNRGRTATHEVGHWLNLRHIWGDAVCGDDFVSDTPTQEQSNIGLCPTWPHVSNCTGSIPNGDNFSNHMDYTDDACRNMFTQGQFMRIDAALNDPVSGRDNLYTPTNLTATGTDGTPPVLCAPHADFIPRPRFVCPGGSLAFKDLSWNGSVASRIWTFQGGTPMNDTAVFPVITYNTPGNYDVTLAVTNAAGTDTKTVTGMVVVSDPAVTLPVPYFEGFESGASFPYPDWYVYNSNGGNTWTPTSAAFYSGANSLRVLNYTGNDKGFEEFITPALDFSNASAVGMTFKSAFAFTNASQANDDRLVVSFSTDCGLTWTPRLTKAGAALASVPNAVTTSFVPASTTQWDNQVVNIASLAGEPNVRFKFEYTRNFGNNIYIDDINITATVGLDELNAELADVKIFPNPVAGGPVNISYNTLSASIVKMELSDVSGRLVNSLEQTVSEGNHKFVLKNLPEPGVYLVKLIFGQNAVTKKLIIQ